MKPFKIKSSELTESNLQHAINFLRNNQAIVIPTETVYGIACNMNQSAALNLYFAKNRSLAKPLPVLISNIDQVKKLCIDIPSDFWVFAEHFWPGPVTVVLKKNPQLNMPCLDPETVAIRFSSHKITQKISQEYGEPLFLSSANISGKVDATSLEDIENDLGGVIKAIINDGDLTAAVPSTIINLANQKPKLIRVGALAPEDIENFMGWRLS